MFDKLGFEGINAVDEDKVNGLVKDMLSKGWVGAPILYHQSIGLITGSHRMAALNKIEEMYYNEELSESQMEKADEIDNNEDYALDVTEIVDEYLDENPDTGFEFDQLGVIFQGTEVEEWKDEIVEW